MIQRAEMCQYSLCMWQYKAVAITIPEACRKLALEFLKLLL